MSDLLTVPVHLINHHKSCIFSHLSGGERGVSKSLVQSETLLCSIIVGGGGGRRRRVNGRWHALLIHAKVSMHFNGYTVPELRVKAIIGFCGVSANLYLHRALRRRRELSSAFPERSSQCET